LAQVAAISESITYGVELSWARYHLTSSVARAATYKREGGILQRVRTLRRKIVAASDGYVCLFGWVTGANGGKQVTHPDLPSIGERWRSMAFGHASSPPKSYNESLQQIDPLYPGESNKRPRNDIASTDRSPELFRVLWIIFSEMFNPTWEDNFTC